MCSVFGIHDVRRLPDPERVQRALQAMRHRGPDGQGQWSDAAQGCALGHGRLSLWDLEGGQQPLFNEDRSLVLTMNGELYGHEAQREALIGRGHVFRTRSDSEVLLHLYEEHGTDALAQLRGEFAFILWDVRARRLFAARDRFGIKPLCYAQHEGALWLSSEAKGLWAAGVPAAWDEDALFQAFSTQYLPPQRSLFSAVKQLPPGHFLLSDARGVRLRRYWDLELPRGESLSGPGTSSTRDEEVEALRHKLGEAVALRLRADVPVAVQLSGGLDSSAVLGLAARNAVRPVHAFTVSFPHATAGYDEWAVAEETAQRTGAVLHRVDATPDALAQALPDAVACAEGLAINAHLPAKYLLARAVRDAGFKAVLTGEGADEVFLGYPHFKRDVMREAGRLPQGGSALDAENAVAQGIQLPLGEGLPLGAVLAQLGAVPSFVEAKATFGWRMRQVMEGPFPDRDPFEAWAPAFDLRGQLQGRHPVRQAQYLWTRLALGGYILRTLGDGTEMAHGVEGRLPFLDTPLVEWALALPLATHLAGTLEKTLLRESTRDVLTPRVFSRTKHPFMAPPLVGALWELLQDTLRSADGSAVPFLHRGRLVAALDAQPSRSAPEQTAWDAVFMTALTAQLLARRLHP